jgi:hypothetical protein
VSTGCCVFAPNKKNVKAFRGLHSAQHSFSTITRDLHGPRFCRNLDYVLAYVILRFRNTDNN